MPTLDFSAMPKDTRFNEEAFLVEPENSGDLDKAIQTLETELSLMRRLHGLGYLRCAQLRLTYGYDERGRNPIPQPKGARA